MENTFLKIRHIFIALIMLMQCIVAQELEVASLEFTGNKHFSSKKLTEIIYLKKRKSFDFRKLRIDKTLLKNFYLTRGYLDSWVEATYTKKEDKISIRFSITEGFRYLFDSLAFSGNPKLSVGKTRRFFKTFKKGKPYSQLEVDRSLNGLEDAYYNNGFPYVRIRYENKIHHDSLVTLNVIINPGPEVHIKKIDIRGLSTVMPYVVRREVTFRDGDIYSRKKIKEIQRRLYKTGLFKTVNTQVVPISSDSTGASLLFQLAEKEMRYAGLRLGMGFEENTPYGATFDVTGEFGHLNLFGTGRSLSLNAVPSFTYNFTRKKIVNPQNQFSITYVEPWLLGFRMPGIFQTSYYQRNLENSPDYDIWSYSLQLQREMKRNWQASATIAYQFVTNIKSAQLDTLDNLSITSDNDKVVSINLRFTRDKRDNLMSPQKGYLTQFKIGVSRSQRPGGDSLTIEPVSFYTKFSAAWNRYQKFPLYKKWILASRFKTGYIFLFNKNSVISLPDRFFLGGASTIRGFPELLVGPVEWRGDSREAIGGRVMVLANTEVRIPFWQYFAGTGFVDAGNVWRDINHLNLSDIRVGTGGGVAIVLPIVVLRFEYGINIFKKAPESRGMLHFGVSFAY